MRVVYMALLADPLLALLALLCALCVFAAGAAAGFAARSRESDQADAGDTQTHADYWPPLPTPERRDHPLPVAAAPRSTTRRVRAGTPLKPSYDSRAHPRGAEPRT